MRIIQKEISIKSKKRGFHLITDEILSNLPEIRTFKSGICNIFLKHTSASLTINENTDPDVRIDFEEYFKRSIPENPGHYIHSSEGADDMPAHLKSSLLGVSLTVPVADGRFNLGIWQGIYLCEHRFHSGNRKLVITIIGD